MRKEPDVPTRIADKSSYQKVFNLYYRSMVMFASKYIKDDDDAEDIVQDSFIALWNNRFNLRLPNGIKSYLYSTVRNNCLNFLRDNKSNQNEDQLRMLQSDDHFAKDFLKEETLRLFYRALDELNENAKRIILLTLEGYGRDEIAEEMSLSLDTVKYHKKTATKALRRKLGQHFYLLTFLT